MKNTPKLLQKGCVKNFPHGVVKRIPNRVVKNFPPWLREKLPPPFVDQNNKISRRKKIHKFFISQGGIFHHFFTTLFTTFFTVHFWFNFQQNLAPFLATMLGNCDLLDDARHALNTIRSIMQWSPQVEGLESRQVNHQRSHHQHAFSLFCILASQLI